MQAPEKIEKFINHVIADEDAEGYDESLPFGGLMPGAPDEAKYAYNEYVKEQRCLEKQGVKA